MGRALQRTAGMGLASGAGLQIWKRRCPRVRVRVAGCGGAVSTRDSVTIRSLRDAKVLVTGAAGFIGARACRRLLDVGAQVDAVVHQRALPADLTPRLRVHVHDLTDPRAASELVDRTTPDVVLHLASHVAGARGRELVQATFGANLASTVALLDAVTRAGCGRFVQIGSLEEPDEDDPADAVPSSPYAAAKWAASAYARMFHSLYGAPVVRARVFMVYGPGQWDLRKLVPYTILALDRGERPRYSSGLRTVDWVYVDDVVEGLLALAGAPGVEGLRVDLGSGRQHTVRDVVERIHRLMEIGEAPCFGARSDRPMEQVRVADVRRSEQVIGWRPATTLDAGLAATIAWYRRARAWNVAISGARLQRRSAL